MKNVLMLAAALGLIGSAALADTYVQGSTGVARQDRFNDGTVGEVSVGQTFGKVTAELDYKNVRGLKRNGSETSSNLVGVNAYYSPVTYGKFTPFVGAGVAHGNVTTNSLKQHGVVYNLSAGTTYALTDNLDAVVKYRYTLANDFSIPYRQSDVSVGVRYSW